MTSCQRLQNINLDGTGNTLFLFAGGNCIPCRNEIPKIQKEMIRLLKKSHVTVFLIQNEMGGGRVTEKDAIKFRADLLILFPVIPDSYGATYYRQFYDEGFAIPGTVILNDEKVIRIYAPGVIDIDSLMGSIW